MTDDYSTSPYLVAALGAGGAGDPPHEHADSGRGALMLRIARLRFWASVERLAYHVMMVARAKQKALDRRVKHD